MKKNIAMKHWRKIPFQTGIYVYLHICTHESVYEHTHISVSTHSSTLLSSHLTQNIKNNNFKQAEAYKPTFGLWTKALAVIRKETHLLAACSTPGSALTQSFWVQVPEAFVILFPSFCQKKSLCRPQLCTSTKKQLHPILYASAFPDTSMLTWKSDITSHHPRHSHKQEIPHPRKCECKTLIKHWRCSRRR